MDSIDALHDLLSQEISQGPELVLSSGQKTNWYLDCRKVTYGHPAVTARAVCKFLGQYDLYGRTDAVGGIGYGGVPIAISVAYRWGKPAFGVRSQPKTHGMATMLPGGIEQGSKVVLVDDVLTTGASLRLGIEKVTKQGAEVLAAVCLMNRGELVPTIDGIRLLSLFTPETLQ